MPELVPWGLVAAGAGLLGWTRIAAWRVARTRSWVPVVVEIVRSEVVWRRSGNTGVWAARIEYRYEVEGKEYRSDRICAGGTVDTSLRGRAEARCALYPVGAECHAFVDPRDPSRACLERTAEGLGPMTAAGVAAAAVGLLWLAGMVP